ncbi:MAG: hypothetical protein ACREKM_05740, partial [Longimicrobiales bacterium]
MSNRKPTMHVLRAVMMALAVLAAPSLAHAQSDDAARARAGLDAAAAVRFDAALARARSQGLPTESLVNKALEGIAKQVPSARIAGAIEQRLAVLGRAQAALGPARGANADISAVADAMQRGVGAEAVRALREQAGTNVPVGVAAHVLADLSERGVPTDVALDVLAAWRQRGGRVDELPDIAAGVDRLVRQGMLPAQAGAAVAGSL